MSAFYPGAGTDLTPPVLFPEIKIWWYMDGQPRSEYGSNPAYYRPRFLGQLEQTMNQCGFQLQTIDGDRRIYYSPSTDQTIHYEINTPFPDNWDPVKHAGSTLVLCGYDINDRQNLIPPTFFSSYTHIITNNITCNTMWKKNILPIHTLSSIMYSNDDNYKYWVIEHETTENLKKYVSVERNIKWRDLL